MSFAIHRSHSRHLTLSLASTLNRFCLIPRFIDRTSLVPSLFSRCLLRFSSPHLLTPSLWQQSFPSCSSRRRLLAALTPDLLIWSERSQPLTLASERVIQVLQFRMQSREVFSIVCCHSTRSLSLLSSSHFLRRQSGREDPLMQLQQLSSSQAPPVAKCNPRHQ